MSDKTFRFILSYSGSVVQTIAKLISKWRLAPGSGVGFAGDPRKIEKAKAGIKLVIAAQLA